MSAHEDMLGPHEGTVQVPDQVGVVEGWRGWEIDPVTRLLVSPALGTVWHPGERIEGQHWVQGDSETDEGSSAEPLWVGFDLCEAPCHCGINAYRSRELLVDSHHHGGHEVYGRVNVWGNVREHELGVRGQYAYPAELFVRVARGRPWSDSIELAQHLEHVYGVPCHVREHVELPHERWLAEHAPRLYVRVIGGNTIRDGFRRAALHPMMLFTMFYSLAVIVLLTMAWTQDRASLTAWATGLGVAGGLLVDRVERRGWYGKPEMAGSEDMASYLSRVGVVIVCLLCAMTTVAASFVSLVLLS